MGSFGDVRAALLALLVLCGVLAVVPQAGAATINATSNASLESALDKARPGDVIQLANGVYGNVDVTKRRYTAPGVTIRGGRGAVINNMVFNASSFVTLTGITLAPARSQANITIQVGSHDITIDNIYANGVNESLGARVRANDSTSNVSITNSEFTQCGKATPCNGLGGTNILVQNNSYHDCADCDMIHVGGTNVQIIGNTMDNGYRTDACPVGCHIDLVQVMSGQHILVAGNRFGYREKGAAQLFISPAHKGATIDDVTAVNNLFWPGSGPHEMLSAIRVGAHLKGASLPTHVKIISNTVMTGVTSSINLDNGYAGISATSRPLIADNIMLNLMPIQCQNAQWVDNLAETGTGCGSSNNVGNAQLDGNYEPTRSSSLVINQANGSAPSTDMDGCQRAGAPDRGAFEYNGQGCSGRPGL
jgi:hypothetical protein